MTYTRYALAMGLALCLAGCATTKGDTKDERKDFVDNMEQETLDDLYVKHPRARQQIQNAAGYAVFSNINTNLIFVTTKGGYGVAVDKPSGERTYMKMASGGIGLGAGVRDGRWIMIFNRQEDFDNFVNNGWDFSGEATAAAKSPSQGRVASRTRSMDQNVITYQLTEAGLALGVSLDGTKFWQYEELNDGRRVPASVR